MNIETLQKQNANLLLALRAVRPWHKRAEESGEEALTAADCLKLAEAEIADFRAIRPVGEKAGDLRGGSEEWLESNDVRPGSPLAVELERERADSPTAEKAGGLCKPIMFGDMPIERMQIDILSRCMTENTFFDGKSLEAAWNELVAFYMAHRPPAVMAEKPYSIAGFCERIQRQPAMGAGSLGDCHEIAHFGTDVTLHITSHRADGTSGQLLPKTLKAGQSLCVMDRSTASGAGDLSTWPEEPTPEMQQAGATAIRFDTTIINKLWTANAVYRAMRAAVKGGA